MTTPTADAVDAVRRAVEGVQSGAAQVIDSSAELRYDDDGHTYVMLTLQLAPPAPGMETWPRDDVYALTDSVRRRLSESDITLPVEVTLTSQEEGSERPAGRAGEVDGAGPRFDQQA